MTSAAPLPAIAASPELLREARTNCAQRLREKGEHALAASYEQGDQDAGWSIRHEVKRLHADNARALAITAATQAGEVK